MPRMLIEDFRRESICNMETTKTLCVVVPCYNEAIRFPYEEFIDFLNRKSPQYFICLVNDGSSDETYPMLQKLANNYPDYVSVLNFQKNSGKAEAVRKALIHCSANTQFDYIAYLDADLATSFEELIVIFNEVTSKPDILLGMGARWQHLGANIQRDPSRHYFGRFFATMASLILKLPVYDTQCGAKIIKSDIIPEVFAKEFISKWIFDVEVIGRVIKKVGLERARKSIIEVPLRTWTEKGDSKITFRDLTRIPYDLFKIAREY